MRGHVERQMAGLRAKSILRRLPHEVLIDHGNVRPMISVMVEKQEIIYCYRHARPTRRRKAAAWLDRRGDSAVCKVSNCDGRTRKSVPETETNPRRVLYATDFSPEFQLPRFSSCTLPRMRTKTPLGPDAGRRLFPVALHVKHWHWKQESRLSTTLSVACLPNSSSRFPRSCSPTSCARCARPLSASRCSLA